MTTMIEVDRLITFDELKPLFGVPYRSKKTISRLAAKGLFPRCRYLGSGKTTQKVWLASEIQEWCKTAPQKKEKSRALST